MSSTFASLKYYNYRLWFGASFVANIGTWMQRVAQDWVVLTVLTDYSGTAVGIVTALQFLPVLFLSAWAGLLADRVDRRKLLMITQSSMGVLALALGVLVVSGSAQLWQVYVFATLLGCVTAIDNPVRQTFVAEMVPRESLSNAVGLNAAGFNGARLIGPGLAGLLIAQVGPGWMFIINGFTFAGVILAMTRMRARELHHQPSAPRAKGQIREGVAYVRGRTDIMVIMCVVGVVSTFGLNFQLTSAVMATAEFGKGPGEYGILGSILAIGSFAGALLAARRRRPRVRLVVAAAFGFGVASGLMAIMPSYWTYALATIPVGFVSLTMLTAANSAIQTSTEPQMRGRVMSLYMMVLLGSTPVGSIVVGWIAETFSARWAIGIGSITAILVSLGAAMWTRRAWDYSVQYQVFSRPHVQVTYDASTEDPETPVLGDAETPVRRDAVGGAATGGARGGAVAGDGAGAADGASGPTPPARS